jgi:hypothetical protein
MLQKTPEESFAEDSAENLESVSDASAIHISLPLKVSSAD